MASKKEKKVTEKDLEKGFGGKYKVKVIKQMFGGYRWFFYEGDHRGICESYSTFDRSRTALAHWRKTKKALGLAADVQEEVDD